MEKFSQEPHTLKEHYWSMQGELYIAVKLKQILNQILRYKMLNQQIIDKKDCCF